MPKYKVRDIVKVKNINGAYYMITNFVNFLDVKGIGTSYRLIKIYPISDVVECIIVNEKDISVIAEKESHEYNMIIAYLNEGYKNIGYRDFTHFVNNVALPPNYDKDIYVKGNAIIKYKDKTDTKNNSISIVKPIQDIIHYHEIDNIDECLDAMNDLKALYENFGDEAYLQLYELVKRRLKKLTQKG